MSLALSTILVPALVPALADGVRALFGRLSGGAGAQPQNVDEVIKLMEAQTSRVQSLAELDKLAPNASPWVADLRGAFRYVIVGGITLTTLIVLIVSSFVPFSEAVLLLLLDLTGAGMSFILGERMYLGLKK